MKIMVVLNFCIFLFFLFYLSVRYEFLIELTFSSPVFVSVVPPLLGLSSSPLQRTQVYLSLMLQSRLSKNSNIKYLPHFIKKYVTRTFFWMGFTLHQQYNGYKVTFQLYWCRKTSGASPCIISGTSRNMSRTTNVP